MVDNNSEILLIEENWELINKLSKEKMSLHQISFEIGVNYYTLKKQISKIALEKKVLAGNITAIQIQDKLTDALNFEKIKKSVWEIS